MEDHQLYYYEMRMTPYPNNEYMIRQYRELVPRFIEEVGGINYLLGQEYEQNYHLHIVFSHMAFFGEKKKCPKKDEIRDIYYSMFQVPQEKKGNPSFKLDPVRNLEKALSYAVKDGNYEASAEWIQIAEEAYSSSYKKKHSMKRSLGDLIDQYEKGEINDQELWCGLGQTRADLNLPLSIRWIDEMVLSIRCKKNPELLRFMWDEREQNKKEKS